MRQILVKKTKHTKELAFTSIDLETPIKFMAEPGLVTVLSLDLDLEPGIISDSQSFGFIWTINPKLAALGGMLLGTEQKNQTLTVFISTVKAFSVQSGYLVVKGKAVESVALRQVDTINGLIKLNPQGVEL